MAATIKDVAKKAGVSISTVSRVINESKPVSQESRKKVLKAIDDLDYQPNEIARSLVTKKSNLIGVIVDDIGNHYVAQIVRGIEEIGRMYGYDILLSSSYGDPDTEIKFMEILKNKQAEGIILVSEIYNKKLLSYKIPASLEFIYLNKYFLQNKFETVKLNHRNAAYDMTQYLIGKGHKNIMYLTYDLSNINNIELEKIEGYEDSIGKNNSHIYKIEGNQSYQAYKDGENILKYIRNNNISAIFASTDMMAIGINNYLSDIGVNVPDEVSIVGYGDVKSTAICRPAITTVKEPYYDIGAVAIRKILKRLVDQKFEDEEIVLPMRIIERSSVKEQ